MLFTGLSIIHYLKETSCEGKLLLPPEAFYENDLLVVETESLPGDAGITRNQIFVVESKALDQPYFIKQPKYFTQDRLESIVTEARMYLIFSKTENLKSIVPKLIVFDKLNYLLITSFIKDISPLNINNELIKEEATAEKIGRLIKLFHSNLPKAIIDSDPNYCRYFLLRKPFPLNLTPNEVYRLRFSKIPGQAEFAEELYNYYPYFIQASKSWQRSVLIHGDIKFDNFIIDSSQNIRLIDWEMADLGDPLWDLAGIWAAYIRINGNYTSSIPLLKVTLYAYNDKPDYNFIEILILYTSINILQNTYFVFEKDTKGTLNKKIVSWAFNALENPKLYINDFYGYETITN
jgi:tRNA A-37 threonylcarbamoyl transferase component Bud32